jgi:hypothetical protein
MSKQVYFFLSISDQISIAKLIDGLGNVSALRQPTKTSNLICQAVEDVATWTMTEHQPVFFRADDFQNLIVEHVKSPAGDYWVNIFDSPVIQFSHCIQRSNEILRGRFYCQHRYVDADGYIVEKSDEFKKWTNRVYSLVKKFCSKNADGYYVGPEAQLLVVNGWKLVDFWI